MRKTWIAGLILFRVSDVPTHTHPQWFGKTDNYGKKAWKREGIQSLNHIPSFQNIIQNNSCNGIAANKALSDPEREPFSASISHPRYPLRCHRWCLSRASCHLNSTQSSTRELHRWCRRYHHSWCPPTNSIPPVVVACTRIPHSLGSSCLSMAL